MSDLKKRQFDEMVSHFNLKVSEMNIARKYKMELLGMITAIQMEHDAEKTAKVIISLRSGKCGSCGGDLPTGEEKFCPSCGRRLEWK